MFGIVEAVSSSSCGDHEYFFKILIERFVVHGDPTAERNEEGETITGIAALTGTLDWMPRNTRLFLALKQVYLQELNRVLHHRCSLFKQADLVLDHVDEHFLRDVRLLDRQRISANSSINIFRYPKLRIDGIFRANSLAQSLSRYKCMNIIPFPAL